MIPMLSLIHIYVPLMLHAAHLDDLVCRHFGWETQQPEMAEWKALCGRIATLSREVTIAIVGKYVELHDAYLSVVEALYHGGYENDARVRLRWVDSEQLDDTNVAERLAGADGILVPGGFGQRGIEGMICTCLLYTSEKAQSLFFDDHLKHFLCLGARVLLLREEKHANTV